MKTYCRPYLIAFWLLLFTNCKEKEKGIVVIDTNETKIELTVSNIKKQSGFIQIGLYNAKDMWEEDISKGAGGNEFLVDRLEVEGDEVKFDFVDLDAGTYALSIYHDENSNNTLDKDGTFGVLPKEPYGFSNNFEPMLGFPKFSDCSFEVIKDKTTQVAIELLNVNP